jgi:hypothetical protein
LLFFRKSSRRAVETPEYDGGPFFLNGVHPDPVGVEREVPGPIAGGVVTKAGVAGVRGGVAPTVSFQT